jgi:hypothetical protein
MVSIYQVWILKIEYTEEDSHVFWDVTPYSIQDYTEQHPGRQPSPYSPPENLMCHIE